MLSLRTILPHTLELLKALQQLPSLQETRLVGGTALALQYGHRQSIDLDFFGHLPEDIEGFEDELKNIGTLSIHKVSPTLRFYTINNIKVDFVEYKYPWIDKAVIDEELTLASPKDIAAMKINAVEGSGTKKDFYDIFILLQHYSLQEILEFYVQKYPEHSIFRALMSLTYFDDADSQPNPFSFDLPEWEEIKEKIRSEVNAFR